MCVICVSDKGVKQPSKECMRNMWDRNPHGAGYMFAKSNYVYIRKGFMRFDDFYASVKSENFTDDDIVIYHFRIATQGGVNPEMTHPFKFTDNISETKLLRGRVNLGICHNGIIPYTSRSYDNKYSDTAYFIADCLPSFISRPGDLKNVRVQNEIEKMIQSKMAFLDYAGNVTKIGRFYTDENSGLSFSNTFFVPFGKHLVA